MIQEIRKLRLLFGEFVHTVALAEGTLFVQEGSEVYRVAVECEAEYLASKVKA